MRVNEPKFKLVMEAVNVESGEAWPGVGFT